jgi:flotillin
MEAIGGMFAVVLGFGIVGLGMLMLYVFVRTRYKKAGPDEALIVFGKRKMFGKKVRDEKGVIEAFRIIRGGGTIVVPAVENYERLSLKMMTLDIDLTHVYTAQGIPINVKAVAQVKIRGDIPHIRKAAEGFLGMPVKDVQATIKETVAGHLRGIIGTLTVEELYRDQKRFQDSVREEANVDLEGMGFEFRSFVFREIQDDQGYLNALGQPKIQDALKNARIATAAADRDAKIEEESARQEKEQKRISVETGIAVADRELDLKRASIKRDVDVANAEAQKAGEMELKVQDISIAGKEVDRQKLELNATIREKADASKYQAERLADADQYRVEKQAAADRQRREQAAAAVKAEGLAKAEAESTMRRDIGLAEAEAIQAKGQAEAEARRTLAEALKQYNEAGLSIEALKVLPEIAAAISEPLARAGSTTIISNGSNGEGTGSTKMTEDVVQVLGQLQPIMQQLTGVDLSQFLQGVNRLPGAVSDRLSTDKRPDDREAGES